MNQEEYFSKSLDNQEIIISILKKMAQSRGLLSKENERKILEYVKNEGIITKRGICNLIKVSHKSALEIMKRLDGRENMAYVFGHGKNQSKLVYIDDQSLVSQKAKELLKIMELGTCLKREDLVKKLEVENSLINGIIKTANLIAGNQFRWESGKLIRYR